MTGLICANYEEFFDYNKSELILNCKILKLEKRSIFNDNKYIFYNQMSTDGFSCSLLFILKEYKDKKYGDVLRSGLKKASYFSARMRESPVLRKEIDIYGSGIGNR